MVKKLFNAVVVLFILLGQFSVLVSPVSAAQLIQCDANGKCSVYLNYYDDAYTGNIEHGFEKLGRGTNSWTIKGGNVPNSFGEQIGSMSDPGYVPLKNIKGETLNAVGVCDVSAIVHWYAVTQLGMDVRNPAQDIRDPKTGEVIGHSQVPVLPNDPMFRDTILQNNAGHYDQDTIFYNPVGDITIYWEISSDHKLTIWSQSGDQTKTLTAEATPDNWAPIDISAELHAQCPDMITDQNGEADYSSGLLIHHTVWLGDTVLEAAIRDKHCTERRPPYLLLVMKDGTVYQLAKFSSITYHAACEKPGVNGSCNNTDFASISVVGNFEEEQLSDVQRQGVIRAIAWLFKQGVPQHVLGHQEKFVPSSEASSTQCPGKNLESRIPELVTAAQAMLQAKETSASSKVPSWIPGGSLPFDVSAINWKVVGIVLVVTVAIVLISNVWRKRREIAWQLATAYLERAEERENSAKTTPVWKLILMTGWEKAVKWTFVLAWLSYFIIPPVVGEVAKSGLRKFLLTVKFEISAPVMTLFVIALILDWIRSFWRRRKQEQVEAVRPSVGETLVIYAPLPKNRVRPILWVLSVVLLILPLIYIWQVRPQLMASQENLESASTFVKDAVGAVQVLNGYGLNIDSSSLEAVQDKIGMVANLQGQADLIAIIMMVVGLVIALSLVLGRRVISFIGIAGVMIVIYLGVNSNGSWQMPDWKSWFNQGSYSEKVYAATPELVDSKTVDRAVAGSIKFNCNFDPIEAGLGPVKVGCDENGLPVFPIRYWNGNYYNFYIDPTVFNASVSAARGNSSLALVMISVANSESSSYNSAVCSGVGACGTWQFMPGTWASHAPAGYEDPSYRYDTKIQAEGAASLIGDGNPVTGAAGMRLYEKLGNREFIDCFYGRTCPCWNMHEPQADYVYRLWTALKVAADVKP